MSAQASARYNAGATGLFELRETLAFTTAQGFGHIEKHLNRLRRSAAVFDMAFDEDVVRGTLDRAVADVSAALVRLRLSSGSDIRIVIDRLPEPPAQPITLKIDAEHAAYDPNLHQHKTNRRAIYDLARARNPNADDVILINASGEPTESTIANLAVLLDADWWTPPLSSGCLPGIGREVALEEGRLRERRLTVNDLEQCGALALISSARGWRPAALVPRS